MKCVNPDCKHSISTHRCFATIYFVYYLDGGFKNGDARHVKNNNGVTFMALLNADNLTSRRQTYKNESASHISVNSTVSPTKVTHHKSSMDVRRYIVV